MIKIIIAPPEGQEKATPNDKPGQEQQQKKPRKTQNAGTSRTHAAEENKTLKQTHETRHKKTQEQITQKAHGARKRDTEIEHHELHYVTIQTKEGSYEAGLIIDNANICPLQAKLNLARYRVRKHSQLILNIPRFCAQKKLPHR